MSYSRVEIIDMSKSESGTIEKNVINYRSSGRGRNLGYRRPGAKMVTR